MCVCSSTVQLRNKLRVVPLSLSSLCMTRKKNLAKEKKNKKKKRKMATRHPGGKKHME